MKPPSRPFSPTLHQNTSEAPGKDKAPHNKRKRRDNPHINIYFIIFRTFTAFLTRSLEEGGCALVGALETLVVCCGLVVEVVKDLVLRVELVAHGGGLALQVAEDAVHRAEIRVHLVFASVVCDALNVAACVKRNRKTEG